MLRKDARNDFRPLPAEVDDVKWEVLRISREPTRSIDERHPELYRHIVDDRIVEVVDTSECLPAQLADWWYASATSSALPRALIAP